MYKSLFTARQYMLVCSWLDRLILEYKYVPMVEEEELYSILKKLRMEQRFVEESEG